MLFEKRRNIMYLRLSAEDEEDRCESSSISSQRECIQQYLRGRPELDGDFEEIVDDGYSGTSLDRPGMKRLLDMVGKGQVGTVIVRDLSRFARNYLEAGYYLEVVFPAADVRFLAVNDGFDSGALEGTVGLDLAIRNLVNQMYSRDLSRKIKSVVDLKKFRGEYAFGAVPYGYKKGEQHNTIVIDEPAAEIVRRIFALAAEGSSISQIARTLNDAHVTTPSVYLAGVRGNYRTRAFWTYESVRNILKNRIYTGDTEVFKSHVTQVGSRKVRLVPEELRQIVPETHAPILSRAAYYAARRAIQVRAPRAPASGGGSVLSSYLVCGCCGNRLAKGKASNKIWRCTSGRYTSATGCGQIRAEDRALREGILRALHLRGEALGGEPGDDMGRKGREDKSLLQRERKRCRQAEERARGEMLELYEQYICGERSREAFLARKKEIARRREAAAAQISRLDRRLEALETPADSAREEEARSFAAAELTPALLKAHIRQIVIDPEGRVQIAWKTRNEAEPQPYSAFLIPLKNT